MAKISRGAFVKNAKNGKWMKVVNSNAHNVYGVYHKEEGSEILLSRKSVYVPSIVRLMVSSHIIHSIVQGRTREVSHGETKNWSKLIEYPDLVLLYDAFGVWKIWCTLSGVSKSSSGRQRRIKFTIDKILEVK